MTAGSGAAITRAAGSGRSPCHASDTALAASGAATADTRPRVTTGARTGVTAGSGTSIVSRADAS
jgi:hypothetical protein